MNSEISEAFKMLGFDLSYLPKLQNVRTSFFKLARKNHPDKNEEDDLEDDKEYETQDQGNEEI